jgi:hypothetical protein
MRFVRDFSHFSALYALAVFSNSRLIDFNALLIDSAATADCIVDVLCLDVVRQSAQGTVAEQQVDVFERFLGGFWKQEPDRGDRHKNVERREDEVVFLDAELALVSVRVGLFGGLTQPILPSAMGEIWANNVETSQFPIP